jgi:hypothetical protein
MSELATISVTLGGVLLALYGAMAVRPRQACDWMVRFPRHRLTGSILAVLALLWSAKLLNEMPMESLDKYKPLLWILTPVSIFLVLQFMEELLAPRALGGLLALVPVPLLDAARFHPSPWSLVIVVLAYAMAIKGMALLLSPYLFRKWAAFALSTPGRVRTAGICGVALAAGLMALGLLVY